MIREFRAGAGDAKRKVSTTRAETPDGIAGAARKALGIEG